MGAPRGNHNRRSKTEYKIFHFSNTPEYQRIRHRQVKAALFGALGNKCIKCNFSDFRALQIDHVYGKGFQERKGSGINYRAVLRKVLEGSKDYQLLCANCNWIKRVENNECGGD